jgi:predicted transcriptional regulator
MAMTKAIPAKAAAAQATTVRLDPVVKSRLEKLGALTHRSLNSLMNDALSAFVDTRFEQIERDLEASLKDLQAYRKSDPGFSRAIAAAAKAEAAVANDPLEGKIVTKLTRADKKALGLVDD